MPSLVIGGVVWLHEHKLENQVGSSRTRGLYFQPAPPEQPDSALHPSDLPNRPAGLRAATDNAVNTFTAPAGCESRRPHGSLRPAPCEPPAPGQNRPVGLRAALSRAVAPARHAAAVFLVVFAGLLAVSTAAQAQITPTTFNYITNSHQSPSGASDAFQAQSFITGPNAAGYLLTEVRPLLNNTAGLSTSVRIRANSASDEPGDLVATLTHSGSLDARAFNTFTVPSDTRLEPNTTYWVTVNEGVASARVSFSRTSGHGEYSFPDTGWSIGDSRLYRSSETDDWSSSAAPLIMQLRGPPHVSVTIVPNQPSIVAGIEDLVFTLTRFSTTDELEATVTIVQDQSWLGTSDLEHTVTFAIGSTTATLTLNASSFSSDPDTAGDLTATVSGNRILGGSTTVEVTVDDDETTEAAVTVTIEAEYDPIGGGLEDLVFTLTRQGTTADELAATVTIAQDEAWLDASDLTHTVTFAAGEATATLRIAARMFSFDPVTSGNLTATVSGTGISGGEVTVEIVSTAQPPITIRYDMSSYTFKEDADDEAIYVVATLHTAYPQPPGGFQVSFSARAGTAISGDDRDEDELGNVFPFDYSTISWEYLFNSSDFVRDADTDLFMARKLVERLVIENDDIYEGSEQFTMVIERSAGLRAGLVQVVYPNGTTCDISVCASTPAAYTVTITDEEDRPELSLSAAPASIARQDDSGTTGIEENVSTLTAGITNGKTFATDRTVTLDFGGTAVEGTDYSVSPPDADPDIAGHQAVLLGSDSFLADGIASVGDSSVEVTVTAMANADAEGNRTVEVSGELDGTDIGSTLITIRPAGTTAPNTSPLASNSTVTTEEDTDYTFSAGDFNFTDADAGDDLASVTVVTLPAAGTLALDGAAVAAGQAVAAADIGKLVFTPAANANGDAYTSFTFRVSDGTAESVDTYTMTVNVPPVNDAPTGVPTIGGMAWPGGTLTADTSGVDDADGMTGVTLAYQWTRLDPEGVLNPVQVGTDSRTYAPAAADIGSNIGVTVSFTDDGNNVEELTSAAVGPVVAEPVTVTIAANHDTIGAGLEDLVFTLTRDGATADVLDATVDISQEQEWLDDSELSHTVTFLAGESTATLKLLAFSFSLDPDTKGDLTATVSGLGISGDSDTVQIVSTPEPPITLRFDKSAYTFAENGVDAAIYAVATLHPDYPRAPSTSSISVLVSSQNGTAETPEDYDGIYWLADFIGIASDYVHDVDIDRLVARKPVPGFSIVNDVTYEGSEHFTMIIERGAPGLKTGLLQVVFPNGTTCDILLCSATPHYPVEITDEEDLPALSLWAAPESIAEEDDSRTTDAENVSTVTVEITNGTSLPADRTVTLRFAGGTAVEGADYIVGPPDADPNATGHQVVLPAGDSAVEATVTAVANDIADRNRTVEVSGELGATVIGRTFITILDDETTAANTPATGQPTIGGTPGIGRVLTAFVSNILDDDGLPSSFDYQWVRVNASDSETVVGSNRTYVPTSDDLGSTIRVQVRFIDAAGNAEGPLASDPTAAVMLSCEANAVWCTTLTTGEGSGRTPPQGYCGPGTGNNKCDYGSLLDDRFSLDGTAYTVESVRWGRGDYNIHFTLDRDFPSARLGSLTLLISTDSLDLSDADYGNDSGTIANNYRWEAPSYNLYGLPEGTQITVQLLAGAANAGATGQPEIEGTPQAGQALTAGMGNIDDADGLPSSFDYQWVRVDGLGRETSVGANSATYAVLSPDVGSTIRVDVSFTDAAGNEEGPLASDPTATVEEANRTLTLSVDPPSVSEDAVETEVTVTGTLDGAPLTSATEVAVTVGASDDTATEGTDYATVGELTLTIEAGATEGTTTFALTPTDDAVDEEDEETLSVTGTTAASHVEVVPTAVTIADNETESQGTGRGVTVSAATLTVPEEGSNTYTVVLRSAPTADVTVTPSLSTGSSPEVSVSPVTLTFTPGNWATAQTVTVEADQDDDAEDDEATVEHEVSGGDYESNGVTAADVAVTVDDDETASAKLTLSVDPPSVSEDAVETEVTVTGTLDGAPLTSATEVAVTVGVSGDTATEGMDYATVGELTLTIEAGATEGTTTFALTPTDDAVDEDDAETLAVTGTTAASGLEVVPTAVTIADDDARGVTVSAATLTVPEEGSNTDTVVLRSAPTADVTVTPSLSPGSSPEVSVSPATLTFTPGNWNTAQTVTVEADQDDDAEDDEATVEHEVSGGDYGSNGVTAADVAVTVDDDETEACVLGGDVWCATLTVKNLGSGNRGCANSQSGNECSNTSHLTEDEFTHDMTDYTVTSVQVRTNGELRLWISRNLTAPTGSLVLVVGSERFSLARADTINDNNRRWDSSGLSWSTGDTIELRLVEAFLPLAPAAPEVNGVGDSETSLKVTWSEPNNAGRPPITYYDLRYRTSRTGTGGWLDGPQDQTGTNATIMGLTAGTQYDVQVRASNAVVRRGILTPYWGNRRPKLTPLVL